MGKVIISVLGKDAVGIIAKVCTMLSENNVNINDISQTIIQGYFNMMMIVDTSKCDEKYTDLVKGLHTLGEDTGFVINCQREEIFTKMHRL